MSLPSRTLDRRLTAEWLLVCVLAVAAALLGRDAVATVAAMAAAADRWALLTGAVLAYEVGFLRYHLRRNRETDGRLRRSLGLANAVTLLRGGLFAATAGFLLVAPTVGALGWAPAACYGLGALLDAVDGAVARRVGGVTELGARLDLAFDTLGFLVAPLVGVAWGRLPVWYLAIAAARYCYLAGVGLHRRRGGTVRSLPESRVRRPLAALQMAFITFALAPVTPAAVVWPAAALLAVPSLLVFGRDFLVVTGRWDGLGDDAAADGQSPRR